MNIIRKFAIALASAVVFTTGVAQAASTADFTDQWWVPSEAGWGASIIQQADTLFVNLMVYGGDGKPTWFTSSARLQAGTLQGHTVFLGDLYSTAGPYFGSGFDPGSVAIRKVGTLAFDAASPDFATLSYEVDLVKVTKSVTRQTWKNANLTGSYVGGISLDPTAWDKVTIEIVHDADNRVTLVSDQGFGYWKFVGSYNQSGRSGKIAATLADGDRGSVTFTEIERTACGFTARFAGEMNGMVITDGRIGGIRR